MQKALIIQKHTLRGYDKELASTLNALNASELNEHFSDGWRFVSAAPFGISVSEGNVGSGTALAAILVIIEKP